MKFIKAEKGRFSFQVSNREKHLLLDVLNLYPLIPASYQRLSRSDEKPEDRELLEEALAAQRSKNKKQLQALLKAKSRFRPDQNGWRFSLKPEQMNWLLQVLNDIRVGSWLQLGSPDGPEKIPEALGNKTAGYFWAMEVCGQVQMALLAALDDGGAA
ncbi:MAG TPA: hypothetical protein VH598_13320 [Verrucomicrobiae bacterium]|nr:hypothetical protein [Verrucomicrobiae bacterium]